MAEPTALEDVVLNDRYWLGLARKLSDGSATRLDDAANKLITAATWFFTVYSASALIGIAAADRDLDVLRSVLVALPSALLVVAYLAALWALMPRVIEFDPRVSRDIRRAHTAAQVSKRKKLKLATAAAVLAAFGVIAAAAATATAPSQGEDGSFAAELSDNGSTVLVSGFFPENTPITVTVDAVDVGIPNEPEREILSMSASTGELIGEVENLPSSSSYIVAATWEKDDATQSIEVMVKPEKVTLND